MNRSGKHNRFNIVALDFHRALVHGVQVHVLTGTLFLFSTKTPDINSECSGKTLLPHTARSEGQKQWDVIFEGGDLFHLQQ